MEFRWGLQSGIADVSFVHAVVYFKPTGHKAILGGDSSTRKNPFLGNKLPENVIFLK